MSLFMTRSHESLRHQTSVSPGNARATKRSNGSGNHHGNDPVGAFPPPRFRSDVGGYRAGIGPYSANHPSPVRVPRWSTGGCVCAARSRGESGAHRGWLRHIFGPPLAALRPAGREHRIAALYAATDVYVWKLLRRDLKLSRKETAATFRRLVYGVLETKREEA